MNDGAAEPSFIQRLLRVGGNGVALLERHFRLISVEAQEEAVAWVQLAALTVATVAIALFAFVLLNCALILLIGRLTGAWVWTVGAFSAFYFVVAGIAGWQVRKWWRGRPGPFAATQSELAKTRQWLVELWPPPSEPKN